MLIAEMVSFQNLLRRNVDESNAPRRVYNDWWSRSGSWANGWSRGSIIFFSLSSVIVLAWVLWETSGILSGDLDANVWAGLASIFINVGLFVGIMAFLSSGAATTISRLGGGKTPESHQFRWCCCGEWYSNFMQGMMLRLLGSSVETHKGPAVDIAWRGRLLFLQNEMNRMIREAQEDSNKKVHDLDALVSQMENRLRHELMNVESAIQGLRYELTRGGESADDNRPTNVAENEIDGELSSRDGTGFTSMIQNFLTKQPETNKNKKNA